MAKIVYIALVMALLLSGCGVALDGPDTVGTLEATESGQSGQSGFPETEGLLENDPREEPLTQIRQADLLDKNLENPAGELQDRCSGMMVRIAAGNLVGSGVILQDDGREVLIATAGHVLNRVEETVEIEFRDGFQVRTGEWQLAETADLAILRVPRESLLEEAENGSLRDHGEEYLRCAVDKDAYDGATVGDVVIAMGSYTGVAEDAYAGTLTEDYVYAQDFGAYMMLAQTPVKPGMSGGGLFDEQGHLLGILCGVSEDGEVAAAPLIALLAML